MLVLSEGVLVRVAKCRYSVKGVLVWVAKCRYSVKGVLVGVNRVS